MVVVEAARGTATMTSGRPVGSPAGGDCGSGGGTDCVARGACDRGWGMLSAVVSRSEAPDSSPLAGPGAASPGSAPESVPSASAPSGASSCGLSPSFSHQRCRDSEMTRSARERTASAGSSGAGTDRDAGAGAGAGAVVGGAPDGCGWRCPRPRARGAGMRDGREPVLGNRWALACCVPSRRRGPDECACAAARGGLGTRPSLWAGACAGSGGSERGGEDAGGIHQNRDSSV